MAPEIPIRNIYFLLSYAFEFVGKGEMKLHSKDSFKSTADLMIKLLENPLSSIKKRGFKKNYEDFSENILGVKGKIDLSQSIKSNLLTVGKSHCNFDELTFNIEANKIIKTCLLFLLRTGELDKDNLKILKKFLRLLEGVDQIKLSRKNFENIKRTRLSENYLFAINLCELIFDSISLSSTQENIKMIDFFQNEKCMDRLFEKFVKNFYFYHLPDFKVESKIFSWNVESEDPGFSEKVPKLKTDVVIRSKNSKLIIDTKYYKEALVNYMEGIRFHRGHLSQIMDYIRASRRVDDIPTNGLLLYPTNTVDLNNSGKIEGINITVSTIDLSKDWKDIQDNLLLLANKSLGIEKQSA